MNRKIKREREREREKERERREQARMSGGSHRWSAGSNYVLIATEEVIWSHYGAPVDS